MRRLAVALVLVVGALSGCAGPPPPLAREPVPCPSGFAPVSDPSLSEFANRYNEIRVEHCLAPVAASSFRWEECLERRLDWLYATGNWKHASDAPGCDGNLAGGSEDTGASVAEKWWESEAHRSSLYKSSSELEGQCIAFAMTHNADGLSRGAARVTDC